MQKRSASKSSLPGKPLISIVTVVYNGKKHLEQTILSVLNQTYDNIEYIIIDGGSSDGTLDIIKKYNHSIDYWVSEPDEGVSDAFNKGIAASSGEMIGILNADDWYEPGCVQAIVEHFDKGDILHGQMNYWTDGTLQFTSQPDHTKLKDTMTLSHPAVFVKRHVYDRIGLFKTSYKLAMDYELLLRAYHQSATFHYINQVLSNMRSGGLSAKYWLNAAIEVRKAKIEHGMKWYDAYRHHYVQTAKYLIFKILQKYNLLFIVKLYSSIKHKAFVK